MSFLATTWRFFTMTVIGLLFVLLYMVLRIGTLFIWNREKRHSAVAKIRGRLLRWWMTIHGATFIKLGQVLSTRPDLLPPEMIAELRKLQDSVPEFSGARARKIIAQELGRDLDEVFETIDAKPVAAASVAQVHRGVLKDGREVAIKVLRPGVRRVVTRDASFMRVIAKMLTIFPSARLSDPVGHADEFIRGILEQTDLRLEAKNYERFGANFEDFEGVHFPEIHGDLSGERVLTMEFVRGRKIDALGEGDFSKLGGISSLMFLKMCFEDGFVHADLHPGNVLVTDDQELVVFDVGLVKQLTDEVLDQFIDFSKCVALGGSADFVNHFKRFHTYMDDVDWEEIERDCQQFIAKYRAQNVNELEMGEFINETFALARKHRIQPLPELTLILVGVVTSEGISKMINPDNNTFEQMAAYLPPIMAKRGLVVYGDEAASSPR